MIIVIFSGKGVCMVVEVTLHKTLLLLPYTHTNSWWTHRDLTQEVQLFDTPYRAQAIITHINKIANTGLSAYNFESLEFSFTLGAVKLNLFDLVLYF